MMLTQQWMSVFQKPNKLMVFYLSAAFVLENFFIYYEPLNCNKLANWKEVNVFALEHFSSTYYVPVTSIMVQEV